MDPNAPFDLGQLLSFQNVLIVFVTWFLITTLRKAFPSFFVDGLGKRLLPVLPIPLAVVLVLLTAQWLPSVPYYTHRVVLGIALGALASNAQAVLKGTGLANVVPGLRPGDRGM